MMSPQMMSPQLTRSLNANEIYHMVRKKKFQIHAFFYLKKIYFRFKYLFLRFEMIRFSIDFRTVVVAFGYMAFLELCSGKWLHACLFFPTHTIELIYWKNFIFKGYHVVGQMSTNGRANGCDVFRGPRGGEYYINSSGNATFIGLPFRNKINYW